MRDRGPKQRGRHLSKADRLAPVRPLRTHGRKVHLARSRLSVNNNPTSKGLCLASLAASKGIRETLPASQAPLRRLCLVRALSVKLQLRPRCRCSLPHAMLPVRAYTCPNARCKMHGGHFSSLHFPSIYFRCSKIVRTSRHVKYFYLSFVCTEFDTVPRYASQIGKFRKNTTLLWKIEVLRKLQHSQ